METKFTEVKATKFTERSGSPRELYELVKRERQDAGSYHQFLYRIGQQLTASPTIEMRFHVVTKDNEHIQFSIKALAVSEEIRSELGEKAGGALQDEKSWREFRKAYRRAMRRLN